MNKTWRPVANPEMAKAFQELRRSSAASPHQDRRTRRARSRKDAKNAAIRDSKQN